MLTRDALIVNGAGFVLTACAVALLVATLTACGQKGPLSLAKPLPPVASASGAGSAK